MRHSSLVLGAIVSLAAPAAGVMAYQSWAPGPAVATDSAVAQTPSTTAAAPVVRFRPCVRPARLEDGVCVTHRIQIVVAPATAGAPLPATSPVGDGPVEPTDEASPSHPVHALPTHHADPSDDPTDGPTAGPTVTPVPGPTGEPSTQPSCEPSDDDPDEGDDDHEGAEGDRTAGGLLGQLAAMVSGTEPQRSVAVATDDDCDGDGEDEPGEEEEEDHSGDLGAAG